MTIGAILTAAVLSPSFSWTTSALSDLGRPDAPTASLFNGGLIAGAILALPFVLRALLAADHPLTRIGTASFGFAAVAMGSVGAFPAGHPYHFPAAFSLYALVTYGLFFYGSGRAIAESVRRGLLAIWLGVAHVTSWIAWGIGLRAGPGLAIPEAIGAAFFVGWIALAWESC